MFVQNNRFPAFWGTRLRWPFDFDTVWRAYNGWLGLACDNVAPRLRQSVQPEQLRHRRQAGAPQAPQPEHQSADRGERVADFFSANGGSYCA
jgi:hypothetical protein